MNMAPSNPPNVVNSFAVVLRELSGAKASHWFRITETGIEIDYKPDILRIMMGR